MKLKVLQQFKDKFNKSLYLPSQIIEIEDSERCNDLIQRGLCESVAEESPNDDCASVPQKPRPRKKVTKK